MTVLGVGLSKTGTTSLARALEILGYPSIHYEPERLAEAINGTSAVADFHRYDDVDAVTDIPAAWFYRELLEVYPETQCILTVRDEDEWWMSISAYFSGRPRFEPLPRQRLREKLRTAVYGSYIPRERMYRKRYREHNEQVVRHVPATKLLVMDITAGAGWDALCPFLDKEVPAEPFPHAKRRRATPRLVRLRRHARLASFPLARLLLRGR